MNVQIFSDLHIEFHTTFPRIKKYAPILILAGYIVKLSHKPYTLFLEYVSKHWDYIIYVFGNHEMYHSKKTIDSLKNEYIQYIRQKYTNIYILDNSYIYIQNYLFIGSTLWSYYPDHYPDGIIQCTRKIKCKTTKGYTKEIGKSGYNTLHSIDRQYILETLSSITTEYTNTRKNPIYIDKDTRIVLVTHYPVLNTNVSNPLYFSKYNSLFQNDMLQDIVSLRQHHFPKNDVICICGHTHYSFDYIEEKSNIRCISNQLGYKDEYMEEMTRCNSKGLYVV